jgi:outer membrane protein TolC
VHSLARHVQLAQQSANLAQKQYELIQIQFRQGTVSQLDVLNDSVALSQARTSLEQARTQLQLAILKLENSIGN